MPDNALATPIAPEMQPQGRQEMPIGTPPQGMAQPQGGQQQQPPAPTHNQTVCALRHFQTFGRALNGVLKNPDLGKADIKSSWIDAMTKLVAERMLSPASAVTILGQLPERPWDQRVALQKMAVQIDQARDAVLAHHAQAFAGQPPEPTPDDNDDHLDTLNGMLKSHYNMPMK